MIEILGMSPISSFSTNLRRNFVSLLKKSPSKAYGDDLSSRYPRQYTNYRGYIVNKDYVVGSNAEPFDFNEGLYFQFNPSTIREEKTSSYSSREYPGMAYVDYIWACGGDKTLSFELFLDNTPQTKTSLFRPEAYGSVKALEIDNSEKNPDSVTYKQGKAYSPSRVSERGVLPEVERLNSFMYPAIRKGESVPKFSSGGVVDQNQFRPPPVVIFTYGPMYYEGIVNSVSVEYTLFDYDLTPIRCTANVTIAVFEFQNLERMVNVR